VFHRRKAATEKALSVVERRVRRTTNDNDEAQCTDTVVTQQLRQRPRSSDIVLQNEKKTVGSPLSELYLYTLRVWRNMSNGNLSRKNEAVGSEATASSCLNSSVI